MTIDALMQEKYSIKLDNKGKEELIIKYYPLIKSIVLRLSRIFPKHIELGTLIQAGIIGFLRAVDNYDDSRGAKFTTFATICIKGSILEELRTLDWATRSVRQKANNIEKALEELERKNNNNPSDEQIAGQLNTSLEKYYNMLSEINAASILSLDFTGFNNKDYNKFNLLDIVKKIEDPDPETKIILLEQKKILGKLIEALSEKERLVITLYYYEELTMKEIGCVMHITESRISQLHNSAVLKLRCKLKKIEALNESHIIPLKLKNEPHERKISWLIYGILVLQLLGCTSTKEVKVDTTPRNWSVIIFPSNYIIQNSDISTKVAQMLSEELNQKWGNVINFSYSNKMLQLNKKNGQHLQNTINDLYLSNSFTDADKINAIIPSGVKAIIVVDIFSYSYFWNDYKKMIKIGIKLKIFNAEDFSPVWENAVLNNYKEDDGGIEQATRQSIEKIIDSMDYQNISMLVKQINMR